jgi:hypothetical protein
MTRKRSYTYHELRALDREREFRAAELAEHAAELEGRDAEMDEICERVFDGHGAFPGVVLDAAAWMTRSSLLDAYYEAFPESRLSPVHLYGALREAQLREATRRGTRGFLGLRPEDAPGAPPRSNSSGPLATLAELTAFGFIGRQVATVPTGWVTRAEVLDLAHDASPHTGRIVAAATLYAALVLLPGVEHGKRKGIRGFRGLAAVAPT